MSPPSLESMKKFKPRRMLFASCIKSVQKIQREREVIKMIKQFKINKSAIIFKFNILKLIEKYLKLMKPSVTCNFFESEFLKLTL